MKINFLTFAIVGVLVLQTLIYPQIASASRIKIVDTVIRAAK